MKFIQPSVEYWPQEAGMEGVWKQIARVCRVSYQSQAREGETAIDFVKRVIFKPARVATKAFFDELNPDDISNYIYDFDKMHGSVLEHGTVYFTVPPYVASNKISSSAFTILQRNKFTKLYKDSKGYIYITTNMRVIIEEGLIECLDFIVKPTKYHPKRYTFNVITDIGVSREGNRMRANSICEESTRYNAYDKEKYSSELTYAQPVWQEMNSIKKSLLSSTKEQQLQTFKFWCECISKGSISNWDEDAYYFFGLLAAEFSYMGMRSKGAIAEKARQLLNLSTKTQVVYTAYAEDWKHFLALRSSQAVSGMPHPNMKLIADKIAEIAKEQKLW